MIITPATNIEKREDFMIKNASITFILSIVIGLPCTVIGSNINNGVFALNDDWSWNNVFSLRGQFDENGETVNIEIFADTDSYDCDVEKKSLTVTKGEGSSWSGSGVTFDISNSGEVTNFSYLYTGSSSCTQCKITTPSMQVRDTVCMAPINLLLQ